MRWVRRSIAAFLIAVSLLAFLGIQVPLPLDMKAVMDLAIDVDLWIINHAAYPGLFLLFFILGTLFALPDLWHGVIYLRERISGRPRLAIGGPRLLQDDRVIKCKQWRMTVENHGGMVARNVRMLLTGIAPRPRYVGWAADYPYPVKRVTAPGLEHSTCNVSPTGIEYFEVLSGWPNAEGRIFTDGLDTKNEGNRIQMDNDERWELAYRVTADDAEPLTFSLIAHVDDSEVIVERSA
jgi:hypothetical protein